MIVKIVSKVKTINGVKGTKNYIDDEKKCMIEIPLEHMSECQELEMFTENQINDINNNKSNEINRLFSYMSNDEKIKHKYMSGYLCNPETGVEEMLLNIDNHMMLNGKSLEDACGNLGYHIVQSFPKGLDISDEEVHQCGLDFVEKLGIYQAIITSHVHPVKNEKTGEITGECKHNHILLCAYRHVNFIDPKNRDLIKYNDSKETYQHLKVLNDIIAIEHGLPVIVEPHKGTGKSWLEAKAIKEGVSWKENIRNDIILCKQNSDTWDEFVDKMKEKKYEIREGKYVTYTSPNHTDDHPKKARDKSLGYEYTKEALLKYFEIKNEVHDMSNENVSYLEKTNVQEIVSNTSEKLYVEVPSNNPFLFELNKDVQSVAINSYYKVNESYSIKTEKGKVVKKVTGGDLFEFYKAKERTVEYKELKKVEELCKLKNTNPVAIDVYHGVYYNPYWRNKDNKIYVVDVKDEQGIIRSALELIIRLAMFLIFHESEKWTPPVISEKYTNSLFYAKKNIKLQRMMDTLSVIKKENIHSIDMVYQKQKTIGNKMNTIRRKINKATTELNMMENSIQLFEEYEKLKKKKPLDEKEKKDYSILKEELMRKNLLDTEQFLMLKDRYSILLEKKEKWELQYQDARKEYKKYKDVEESILLAANDKFSCGPLYHYDREPVSTIKPNNELER